jgi:hypothetical protein
MNQAKSLIFFLQLVLHKIGHVPTTYLCMSLNRDYPPELHFIDYSWGLLTNSPRVWCIEFVGLSSSTWYIEFVGHRPHAWYIKLCRDLPMGLLPSYVGLIEATSYGCMS